MFAFTGAEGRTSWDRLHRHGSSTPARPCLPMWLQLAEILAEVLTTLPVSPVLGRDRVPNWGTTDAKEVRGVLVQGLSRSREGGVIRRDEGGHREIQARWGLFPGSVFRVLPSAV